MAKPPKEPAKIPNDKKQVFQRHLAIHILLKEDEEKLKARRKANAERAKQDGIDPKELKDSSDLAKKSPSEIAAFFSKKFEYLDYQGVTAIQQFNLFGGADAVTPKKSVDFYHAGLMAALHGKDGNPPQNLKGPDQQRWTEGWGDGVEARVWGGEKLAEAEAALKAANAKPSDDDQDEATGQVDEQTDLEDAAMDAGGAGDAGDAGAAEEPEFAEVEEDVTKDEAPATDAAEPDTASADLTADASDAKVLTIELADFGPEAELDQVDLSDCGPTSSIDAYDRVEIVDGNRVNVLKNRDGQTGIFDRAPAAPVGDEEGFEASPEELRRQKARPSTVEGTDPEANG